MRLRLLTQVTAIAVLFIGTLAAPHDPPNAQKCRYLPGDPQWPSENTWKALNISVSGRLIHTQPAAHVCHDPTYNEQACAAVRQDWEYPWGHYDTPSGFMAAYQQNASCDPFTPRETPCRQGNYVEYAIEVLNASDVVAGIKFAREQNIRLVIKNTGHDYFGKSTGKGALSLWMHKLKNIEFLNYNSQAYKGRAIKMGAGVQAFEAYTAADKVGLNVLGGECITVGVAGGYTQGGGHSLISSKHGMGADQALEWEVVTADGKLVTATPTQNSDLYWALSGGGGGTFGVVLSLTSRAYPNEIMGGASFAFTSPSVTSDDTLWAAISFFHQTALPKIVDAGAHVQWIVLGPVFYITEATIPGATEADMHTIFKPFTDYLSSQKIQYQLNVTSFPTFYQHADKYIGPFPHGLFPSAQIQGGVMISRDTAKSNTTSSKLISRLRHISTTTKFRVVSYALNASRKDASTPPNAVLPAWRDMLSYFVISQPWDYTVPLSVMQEQERQLTNVVMPPLQELASGAYLNEADFKNPKWKEEFYGVNWDRLSRVKDRWDPKGFFYGVTAVGSEKWHVADDGRMCRV